MIELLQDASAIRAATDPDPAIEKELSEAEKNLANNHRLLSAARVEYEKLVASEQKDNLKRILDGESAAPPKLRRQKMIQTKKSEIETREMAGPILQNRIEAARMAVQCRNADRSRMIYPRIQKSRMYALDALRAKVAECIPLVAELAAHEEIQTLLLGRNFRIPAAVPSVDEGDFDALKLAMSFLSEMPPRIRPDDDDLATIDNLIATIVRDASAKLIGDNL